MIPSDQAMLKQRADLTYRKNVEMGRHGWLRLTPAYSVKVVEKILANCSSKVRILDPFCGTGTTALCASYHGHDAETIDVNPFLVWLASLKTAHYDLNTLSRLERIKQRILKRLKTKQKILTAPPPIFNIDRWWSKAAQEFLVRLKESIEMESEIGSACRSLLTISFCRILIQISNAAFNHQSMSFKSADWLSPILESNFEKIYEDELETVILSALKNPSGKVKVHLGDSTQLRKSLTKKFDFVITSPPYANRMSYVGELRPYMYWLDFLKTGREAGELDWKTIGGTWGIATSNLSSYKRPDQDYLNSNLDDILARVGAAQNPHSEVLKNYVAKYFADMWMHFSGLTRFLKKGARLHYIVGNSTFYGNLVPVEQIYASMLVHLGFEDVTCIPLRKRNSKKELVEFDVSATWPIFS